ncbi:MAG: FAD-dependent oxidoreductase [Pseudomonadota bacterium]
MDIAVIGSGIAGNSAAWALSRHHNVTVFEKRDRLGGHSATVDVPVNGQQIPVDTGFIVYNEQNYPLLTRLFDHLDVQTEASEMAFSVSLDDGKLEWCGTKLKGVFAQRSNLFSPGFLRMLRDIFRFNKRARLDLQNGALCGLTLDDYLNRSGFSKRLKYDYLVPMTSAIWSTPSSKMLEFPAESLIRFMKNHSLIQSDRPKWRTVSGGSREYVKKLTADTKATFRTGSDVVSVERVGDKVAVTDTNNHTLMFDQVVMASHSDQSLKMLANPTHRESEILGAVQYTKNDVWLHRDPALMPRRRNAWAAWNYLGAKRHEGERDVSVTYWMNRLQNIREDCPLFVTLNPLKQPADDMTYERYTYAHPLFNADAIGAQNALHEIQGTDRIWYCGAWCGYGFHEDGLKSGLLVAEALGSPAPWLIEAADVPASPRPEAPQRFVEAAE